jgi:hypothetical protein
MHTHTPTHTYTYMNQDDESSTPKGGPDPPQRWPQQPIVEEKKPEPTPKPKALFEIDSDDDGASIGLSVKKKKNSKKSAESGNTVICVCAYMCFVHFCVYVLCTCTIHTVSPLPVIYMYNTCIFHTCL